MDRRIVAGVAFVALAVALAACGGGGGGSKTATASPRAGASPATTGTSASGPETGSGTSTVPGLTPLPGTPGSGVPTLTSEQATLTSGIDPGIGGGDPNASPVVVSTIPPVKSKGTPVADSTEIAPAQAEAAGVTLLLDLDASTPGIQATRTVNAGDTLRVAVVITNAPAHQNGFGGVAALDFEIGYDHTKIIAPTISGGPPTARNPLLNVDALGGAAAAWDCLPAPEGDLDDPGGTNGDGKPDTGQAFLSCFTTTSNLMSGTIVLATIEFVAVAPGTVSLNFNSVDVGDALGQIFAYCGDHPANGTVVPCTGATLTVK